MPRSLSTHGGSWDPFAPRKWGVWVTQATVGTYKRIQQVLPIWFIQIWSNTWMGFIWSLYTNSSIEMLMGDLGRFAKMVGGSPACCVGSDWNPRWHLLENRRSAAMSFAEWGNQIVRLPYWSKHHGSLTHHTPTIRFWLPRWSVGFAKRFRRQTEVGR